MGITYCYKNNMSSPWGQMSGIVRMTGVEAEGYAALTSAQTLGRLPCTRATHSQRVVTIWRSVSESCRAISSSSRASISYLAELIDAPSYFLPTAAHRSALV